MRACLCQIIDCVGNNSHFGMLICKETVEKSAVSRIVRPLLEDIFFQNDLTHFCTRNCCA